MDVIVIVKVRTLLFTDPPSRRNVDTTKGVHFCQRLSRDVSIYINKIKLFKKRVDFPSLVI